MKVVVAVILVIFLFTGMSVLAEEPKPLVDVEPLEIVVSIELTVEEEIKILVMRWIGYLRDMQFIRQKALQTKAELDKRLKQEGKTLAELLAEMGFDVKKEE